MRHAIALGLLANLAVVTIAYAASQPQPTVQDFLVSCSKADVLSRSDCDEPIHVNIMATALMQTHGGDGICLPQDGGFSKLRSDIVRWLSGHPELRSAKDYDGVGRAMKALYPCS
jgi:hypothetical protein